LRQFPSLANKAILDNLADPRSRETFDRCKLDPEEATKNAAIVALHRDLLRLRRDDPAFRAQRSDRVSGAVLGDEGFVLRFFCEDGDRLLLVNMGGDLILTHLPEPLLASPTREAWKLLWSSDDPRYGGFGVPPVEGDWGFRIPGQAAVVLG
jgi:maltooligosyltrehalose trehalohydrolase